MTHEITPDSARRCAKKTSNGGPSSPAPKKVSVTFPSDFPPLFGPLFGVLLGALLAGCGGELPASSSSETPPALERAHEAWLAGDLAGLTREAGLVLASPNRTRAAEENIAALLETAWAAGEGRLPADWSLHGPVTALRVSVIRKAEPDGVRHRLVVSGQTTDPAAITDLELRHSDAVVLHRNGGLGTWSTSPKAGANPPEYYFELESEELPDAPPEDAWTIRVTLRDHEPIVGWFPMTAQRASQTPVLRTPSAGAVLPTLTPRVRWEPFRSPEYQPWERRSMSVYVVRRDGPGRWSRAWSWWASDPETTELTVGASTPHSDESPPMQPGRHWISVTASEARFFGPLELKRAARTAIPVDLAP